MTPLTGRENMCKIPLIVSSAEESAAVCMFYRKQTVGIKTVDQNDSKMFYSVTLQTKQAAVNQTFRPDVKIR